MTRYLTGIIVAAAAVILFAGCGRMTPAEEARLEADQSFEQGLARFKSKDYKGAAESFKAALGHDPSHEDAANSLAWVEAIMGEDEKSAGGAGEAGDAGEGESDPAEEAPTVEDLFRDAYLAATAAYNSGDYETMLEHAEAAMDLLSEESPAYYPTARGYTLALLMSGHYEDAAEWSAYLLERNPADTETLRMAVMANDRTGDLDNAAYYAELAHEAAPDPLNKNNLAYTYAELGTDLDYARELAESALLAHPNDPAFLDTMGWVLYKQGDREAAIEYLAAALDRYPPGEEKDEVVYHYETVMSGTN